MPNWCSNSVEITGPKDQIQKLWDEVQSYEKDESKGLLTAMYPNPSGEWDYGWCVDNWSTKWDVNTEGLELVENNDELSITGYFDSAWGPPVGAYDKFLEQNPDCNISASYEEPGMDFAGVYDDGEDRCLENYSEYADEVIKNNLEKSDNELYNELDDIYDLTTQRRDWIEMNEEEENA